jgi:signal transduction histidine kinase
VRHDDIEVRGTPVVDLRELRHDDIEVRGTPVVDLRELCHDVRQPVAAILAMVAAARQQADSRDAVAGWLDAIESQATWLSDLARGELARGTGDGAQQEDGHPAAVDIDRVVGEVAATVTSGSGCRVRVRRAGRPLWVRGDRVQLGRAVLNLLDNAVRAAGPGGSTEVRVTAEHGLVSVDVDDDGPGFARIAPGSGLGLKIAQRAAAACGGRLNITDSQRGGACVRLALPLAARVPDARVAMS